MRLCLLAISLLGLLAGRETDADWIEIPQFSDQQKVYRLPVKLQSHRKHDLSSDDRRFGSYLHKLSFDRDSSLRNVSTLSENDRPSTYDDYESVGTIATFTTERVVTEIVDSSEDDSVISPDEGISIESDEEEQRPQFDMPPTLHSNRDYTSTTSEPIETTTTTTTADSADSTQEEQQQNNQKPENNKGFLNFLPIDLLKKVHKTLKSQPPTLKGKIRFLKTFERTLLSEIESRLSTALAPLRKPRGARGYDSHEEGIGFPSLEGTLMAISFLTFAVYLIRLVMTLFRNAANNNITPPIFIGRKKRSVDDFSEQAARILSYLESPGPYIKE